MLEKEFAISYKKNIDFVGKESLLKIKEKKIIKKLIMLTLNDSKPGEPLLLHDEPIYKGDEIIGRTTSGNFSFNYNKNLAFGYINTGLSKQELLKENLFIEVEKKKYPASIILKPLNAKNIRSN
jgi:glycine cleavage system aminomethyltransferase T